MLSTIARHLARVPCRATPTFRISTRTLTAASTDITPTPNGNMNPTNPEFFAEFDDVGLRSHLNKLRDMENDLMATVNATSPEIDWEYWKAHIKHPAVVDELKEVFDSVPVADIDSEMEKARKQVDEVFDPIIKEYEELAAKTEEDTALLEKQIADASFLRDNIQNLTVEEFMEKHPSVKKSIEDDIKNNKWFIES